MYLHYVILTAFPPRMEGKTRCLESQEGRNGKHKPGKLRIQIVTDRNKKAILVYTAMMADKTVTDLLISGGMEKAESMGIVDSNGKVSKEHSEGVQFVIETLKKQEGDK